MAKSRRALTLIASFKLVKALTLGAVATAVAIRGPDIVSGLHAVIGALKIDPENRVIDGIVERVSGVPAHTLHEVAFGTFVYAAVFATEGTGLLLRKRWAEYLTIVVTGSFLPFEVYEMVRKLTLVRLAAIVVNAAIVVYLIWNLRRERQEEGASGRENAGRENAARAT
jgi:uncharacterized membrane protein (DUF2068 family)